MAADLRQRCVAAFKQCDHDEAERLLPEIQEPQDVLTEFTLSGDHSETSATNVTLLHLAFYHGWLDIIKTMEGCFKWSCKDSNGYTLFHYAAAGGSLDALYYIDFNNLIEQLDYSPIDSKGTLPLHIACLCGNLEAVKYFIDRRPYYPNCLDQQGKSPLHYASQGGHLSIIEFLSDTPQLFFSDPKSTIDHFDRTILHLASYFGHVHIVQRLLYEGKVNILAKDSCGKCCLDVAGHVNNRFELQKLIKPFMEATQSFPLHTFSKTVLLGSSGAGKTTLAKVIHEGASSYLNLLRFGNTEQLVVTHTAGIVPSLVNCPEVGEMVLFDLAGHTKYHSSHFSVMEIVMQWSPATFINVIDLSDTESEIKRQLHYWLNFIDNATFKTSLKSCVVVVGSHADLLNKQQLKTKSVFIRKLVNRRPIERLEFLGFVAVDCCKIDRASVREFMALLSKSHKVISSRAPSISYHCHLLYAFLRSKPQLMSTCTLQEIITAVACDEDTPLSSETSILTEILVSLSDKGMIIFIQNQQRPEKSWVVVDTEKILKEMNGSLFAPRNFKEHCHLASSTGIVLSSSLKQLFPQYNLEMLIDFLQISEHCHRVNLSGNTTNIQSIETTSAPSGDIKELFLFFPSLIDCCRPSSLPGESKFTFCWTISYRNLEYQSFTSRFLHVLLLRLAYTYPLADVDNSETSSNKCIVWTNGITWENEEGIRTLVELIDYNQRIVVAMSHKTDSRPVECSKHRSAVIRLVLDLKQQLCPNVQTDEYLISPSLFNKWSAAVSPSENYLFSIENIKSMLLHDELILSKDFDTKDVLQLEPHQLSPSSVCELMDSSKADDIASHSLLREVKSRCQLKQLERQTHTNLKKCIDQFSIFAGRDLIVSTR